MNTIIYIVGLVVVIGAILGFLAHLCHQALQIPMESTA